MATDWEDTPVDGLLRRRRPRHSAGAYGILTQATERERRGLEPQVEAATFRLICEPTRCLLFVDPGAADMNQVYYGR